MVIAAFAISAATGGGSSASSSGPLAPLSLSAPPNVDSQAAACTKVLEAIGALPLQLDKLDPRVVHTTPETPFVVAWGDPAVILRCGVDRPKSLVAGSATPYIDGGQLSGPYYDVTRVGDANVYTTVDRAAYISITVPSRYAAVNVVTPLSTAIAKALPAVCSTDTDDPSVPISSLCTRRK